MSDVPFSVGAKVRVKRSRKLTGVVVSWRPDPELVEVKVDSGLAIQPNRFFRPGEIENAS